ncbi:GspH/FimT family pseudopilin [Oleiagrimonas sp. C23AA]|uniref:GspH/FimT family pseudopilin n=1 Tax=Oleiagrimonas sp. C23AA TaxID=2719047 RepID=UPI00141F647E|nr:GspH/FimT family pseudopilin [Oleiagrimonas sp. C23AA]NII09167.1 prepilin-type N-terminal cleavage/methylation domain-containing protein [Oleiagrimonas sp. C23AA]
MSMRNEQRGFTLIELMVTVVVVAILASIALPNFRSFMRRNAVSGTANSVMADLQYARSQAIAQGGNQLTYVSICPSTDGSTCVAGAVSYDAGWLVYTDPKPKDGYAADAQHQLLRVAQPDSGVSIRAINGPGGVLTFNPRGELLITSNDFYLAVCSREGSGSGVGASTSQVPGLKVEVSMSGRIVVRKLQSDDSCGS